MTAPQGFDRRRFNAALTAGAAAGALSPFGIVRAQPARLKLGVLLPRSGFQGFIGQSCQKGADLAPAVLKEMLGVEIELMNADTETNVDAKGQVEGIGSACIQNFNQSPTVVLPEQYATAKPVFPIPG